MQTGLLLLLLLHVVGNKKGCWDCSVSNVKSIFLKINKNLTTCLFRILFFGGGISTIAPQSENEDGEVRGSRFQNGDTVIDVHIKASSFGLKYGPSLLLVLC